MRMTRLAGLLALSLATLLVAPQAAYAEGGDMPLLGNAIGAGLAIGLSAIGAGYAIGKAGAASSSATAEKPELFGRLLIYLVLGEGLAIYGLLIAILILVLNKP
ncbi:MAG: ATP synthase subunit C [Pyrodictiaceae archaeon]